MLLKHAHHTHTRTHTHTTERAKLSKTKYKIFQFVCVQSDGAWNWSPINNVYAVRAHVYQTNTTRSYTFATAEIELLKEKKYIHTLFVVYLCTGERPKCRVDILSTDCSVSCPPLLVFLWLNGTDCYALFSLLFT